MQIKGKYIICYYAVLLLIMMSWTDYNSFPSMIFRIVFLLAVIVPGYLDRDCTLPAAITCFWGIAVNGYAYSYMPTQEFLYVGILMISSFKDIDWTDIGEALPAFFAGIFMAFCYSISYGIAAGFIFYCIVKICRGKAKEIHPILWVCVALFILNFILLAVL